MSMVAKFGKYEAMESMGMYQVHELNAFGRFVVFQNVASKAKAIEYAKHCHMAYCARSVNASAFKA